MPITDIFDPATGASGGGAAAAASTVEPPAPTSQATASGVNFTAKTFGAFTDADSVISSYTAVTTNADGSASWSGSGLGAYTATSAAGNSGTLSLNAKNAAGEVVATAVHTYDRAAAAGASLDPTSGPGSMNSAAVATAVTGWVAGTVAFAGPTAAAGATIGGADAAYFNLTGGANGTVTVVAASNLAAAGGSGTAGIYEITLNVNNAGGSGFTTSTLQVTVRPNSSPHVFMATSDGYVVQRVSGGAWAAVALDPGSNISGVAVSSATAIGLLTKNIGGGAADTWNTADLTTTGGSGWVNIEGTNTPTNSHYSPRAAVFLIGNNARGIRWKTEADVVSDGAGTSNGFSIGTVTSYSLPSWGSGDYIWAIFESTLSGRTYAGGESARLSYCTSNFSSWTYDGAPGGWSGTIWGGCGNATYDVLVGASGQVAYTTDGSTWTRSAPGGSLHWDVAVSPGGQFCAVGSGGTIYTTSDPTAGWTARTSGVGTDLRAVAWDSGGSEWVVGGASKVLLTSADGITWSSETVPAGPGGAAIFTRAQGVDVP